MIASTTALAALLLAAAATTAEAAAASTQNRMALCGKQMCLLPNKCRDVDGVSVCVRTNAPKCSDAQCKAGFECALMQDVCASLPCHPKAYCVKSNPCGDCASPDNFCQLLPTPVCQSVVQPTCKNKVCSGGEICSEESNAACATPPCRAKLACTTAAAGYQGAGAGGAGGASGAGGSGGSSGSGGSGGSSEELRSGSGGGSGKKGDGDEDDD